MNRDTYSCLATGSEVSMIANPSAACLPIRLLVRSDRTKGNCGQSIAKEFRKAGGSWFMNECAILNLLTARPRGGGGGKACMHA